MDGRGRNGKRKAAEQAESTKGAKVFHSRFPLGKSCPDRHRYRKAEVGACAPTAFPAAIRRLSGVDLVRRSSDWAISLSGFQ
jgi:hypothetical protein